MSGLVKLLIVIGLLAVVGVVAMQFMGDAAKDPHDSNKPDERPRLEQKYGYTTEGVGG
ncbi:MAG: hypothetical protein LC135_13215 [Phycisphaerae bacterium]|nr:hypothetical protein [Phycisphaerae bacterium]MCZ2400812.1 hypothetical protein [Phycisphaerae bacterium]NUQ48396.1 hypothetical protein [Phycisphaerae bacterium]